jgi:6-phosphogluconolactonase (cycloisomerase 2 family)
MRRNGIRVKIAAITSILLASMVASVITLGGNYAYALNYRPVEFIKTVDGTTLIFTYGITIDNEGRVIVTDTAAQKVYVLKNDDGSWRLLGSFDRRSAVDLGIDSNGNLVVLTHVHPEGAIYVYELTYDGSGNLVSADIVKQLNSIAPDGSIRFRHPHGLAVHTVDGNDYILIGDNQSRRVQVYDSNLNLLFSFNNAEVYDSSNNKVGDVVNGSALNSSIHDVKVGKDNTIMVAYKAGIIGIYRIDYVNKGVERLLNIGEHGTALGYFNEPRGVAYDASNDYLIVSDNLNHRIQVFNYSSLHDGVNEPLFYFGSGVAGDGERQLNTPRKILLHDNRLYVADGSNGRIVILELDDMIPNDADKPSIEPLEPSEWYKYSRP